MTTIGVNLTQNTYYSNEFPWIDRIHNAGEWGTDTGAPLQYDANGNPILIPPAGASRIHFMVGLDPPAGSNVDDYVLTFEGNAAVNFASATAVATSAHSFIIHPTASDGRVYVELTYIDPTNPPRNFHFVRADQVDLFNAGEIFNPAFVAMAQDWTALRFMDWNVTNINPLVHWQDRPTLAKADWSTVPLEVMVSLSNEAHTDLWFNIPTKADDDYVRQATTYIRDHLDPTLKVHLEYTNEAWNWGFEQAVYLRELGNQAWGRDANGDGRIDPYDPNENLEGANVVYYGYRAAQVASIAQSVFGTDDRLHNVLATQTGWRGLEWYIFNGIGRANVGSTADLFDEYAVTTYFGNTISGASSASDQAKVLQWARSGAAGMDAAFAELEFGGQLSANDSLSALFSTLAYQKAVAARYNLSMVAYEGGLHIVSYLYDASVRQEVVDFVTRLVADTRMTGLLTKMVNGFSAAGGDLLMEYTDVGGVSQWGSWGLIPDIYSHSERYDQLAAMNDAAQGNTSVASNVTTVGTGLNATAGTTTTTTTTTIPSTNTSSSTVPSISTATPSTTTSSSTTSSGTLDTVIDGNEVRTTLASYTLGANLENLTFTGTGPFTGTGNALNNVIRGSATGPNRLDGGAGADTMIGGSGNDLYFVDNIGDVVVEAPNGGTDELRTTLATYTLGDNIEYLTYIGIGSFTGTGNALNNVITGGNRDDILDGGAGADFLIGGEGNDIYIIDNAGDTILEQPDAGIDEVRTTLASYTLGDNLENLTFTGAGPFTGTGNALANVIRGSANAANVLNGGAGADTLIGGSANDIYIVDNVGDVIVEAANGGTDEVRTTLASYTLGANLENLTFTGTGPFTGTGNALNNVIRGSATGPNRLDGGAGADTMIGGSGNDLYFVDNIGDVVVEAPNGGTDELRTTLATYTLGDNIEYLTYIGIGSFTGTGNALNNVITGGNRDDILDGGAGADFLIGGEGNDIYIIDNAGDTILEQPDAGIDTVRVSASSYLLPDNVERMIFTGTGAFKGVGNASDNYIAGSATSANKLYGGAGNDTLIGGSGADYLDGGTGADTMTGGAGNDVYIVDDAGDVVIELPGGGLDEVRSTASTYTLSAEVENLTFIGTGNFIGRGNAGNNMIVGGDGNDMLYGDAGDDILIGGRGDDMLFGGTGNDRLIGSSGKDRLSGGAGADVFEFHPGDLATTAANTTTVTDFSRAEQDKLDFTAFRSSVALNFIGTGAFGRHAGEVRYQASSGQLDVSIDLDGDGVADLHLMVSSASNDLVRTDFAF